MRRTYSAECDGALLGRLALEEVEKGAEAAIGVAYSLAVFESEDPDGDFVEVGFRVARVAVLFGSEVSDVLDESRGRPGPSPASGAAAAASGMCRRAGRRMAGTDATHGDIAVPVGSRSAATLCYTGTACAPDAGPGPAAGGASTRTRGRRH
jgi:hypothetical protein